jgi:hypothetical protein
MGVIGVVIYGLPVIVFYHVFCKANILLLLAKIDHEYVKTTEVADGSSLH